MIQLNVGNKWDYKYLDRLTALNRKYKRNGIRVSELYGNPNTQFFCSGVRPDNRIPQMGIVKVLKYINEATERGFEINYTLNRSCLGNIKTMEDRLGLIKEEIKTLQIHGVKRFTIYSPFLIHKLKNTIENIEISTIHNNTNVNYIRGLADLADNIDKICLPIYINRDIGKIKKLLDCIPSKINMELIVNEFCVSTYNTCIYRTECYNIQSHNINYNYPFTMCSLHRTMDSSLWIKAPFILPQWLDLYENVIGIKHFKVTGRTLPAENLLQVIEWYLKKKVNTEIHNLWGGNLCGIELVNTAPVFTKDLVKKNFISKFMKGYFPCEREICGVTCKYCDNILGELYHGKEKE